MDVGGTTLRTQGAIAEARRTRSFQYIEFKQLFFLRELRELRAFVVNAFAFVLKRILSQSRTHRVSFSLFSAELNPKKVRDAYSTVLRCFLPYAASITGNRNGWIAWHLSYQLQQTRPLQWPCLFCLYRGLSGVHSVDLPEISPLSGCAKFFLTFG